MTTAWCIFCFLITILSKPVCSQTENQNDTQKLKDLLARFPGTCGKSDDFDCGKGVCIPVSKFRDCTQDCADGADEECWPGMVRCDGCRCVNANDVGILCIDKQINKICNASTSISFKCKSNTNCVLKTWLLDGLNDCGDWSDEDSCFVGKSVCPSTTTCRFDLASKKSKCECKDLTQTFNGVSCVSKNANVSSTTQVTSKTQVTTPAGPSIATTVNTLSAHRCNVTFNINDMYSNETIIPISFVVIFNTRSTMMDDLSHLRTGLLSYWLSTALNEPPGRIDKFVILPYAENLTEPFVTSDPQTFDQTLLSLNLKSTLCRGRLFGAIQKALTLTSLHPGSIINVFTDSDPSDTILSDSVIQKAVLNKTKINIVYTGSSTCNENLYDTYTNYKKLADYTGGEFFQLSKRLSDYLSVLRYLGKEMKQSFLGIESHQLNHSGSVTTPIDSSLDEVVISLTGMSLNVQIVSINKINILLDTANVKLYNILLPIPEELSIRIIGNSTSDIKINGIGLGNYKFIFSPDPNSVYPTYLQQPIYGPPTSGLISKLAYSRLFVSTQSIIKTAILNEILSISSLSNFGKNFGYSQMTSPFYPTCKPFYFKVLGINYCGEHFQRMSLQPFQAQEADMSNNLPGTCASKQFDCGSGYCIDGTQFRDGRVDCATGMDEAVPMDDAHCSSSKNPIPIDYVANYTSTKLVTTTIIPSYYNSTLLPPPEILDLNGFIYQRIYNNTCKVPGMFFQCTDNTCISVTSFRDGIFNCKDGSDEVCPKNYRKCQNGKCVAATDTSTVCEFDYQMHQFCANYSIMFPCKLANYCVRWVDIMNDIKNCPDNSDEDPTYLSDCELGYVKCDPNAVCTKTHNFEQARCVCEFSYNGNGTHCVKPHSR